MKKYLLSPWTALLTLAVVVSVVLSGPVFVESIRLRYFDQLITSQPATVNENIYTVNIDEAALDKLGQWPPARGDYAQIIHDLYQRNAGLVVWNVLMPEMDRMKQDSQLASVMKQYPVILNNVPAQQTKNTPKAPGASIINSDYADRIVTYPGIIANTPLLENNAAGVGIVNTMPEVDGVNRRMPLVVNVDGKLYPSLALETLRVAAGDPSFQIKLNELGVEKLRIPKFGAITTDELGRVWVDITQKSISTSLVDLPQDLKGSIVIVGPTAAGIGNPVPTSAGAIWPHEMHAAVIGTMINKVNIERPDWAPGAELLTLIGLSLIILLLSRWVYIGITSGIVLLVMIVPISYYLFETDKILIDATMPLAGGVLVMLHAYGIKFISEFLQKQQIKKQFGTYLSPAMVEKLQKNPELLQLGGETKELSIMFTDVRGFTSISEHYGKDVQGLTKIMNRYMTAMTAKIIDNNGTLDKYIGDAQMAFWNAPIDDPDHAIRAVKTGLEMLNDLDRFNEEIEKEGIPAFGMGLGINTGSVVVGNMGSSQRFDYTCLGDAVNLASRLEGQSKNYGVRIIIGPDTANKVKDVYNVVELDTIAVKGKTEGVKVYTVVTQKPTWAHTEYLEKYYSGNWKLAEKHCKKLIKEGGELQHYYENMLARIEEGLPANWDGTYRATSK